MKQSLILPSVQNILDEMGENIKLARLRRKLSADQVAVLQQEVKNFHQVDSGVFRCAQPSRKEFRLMDSLGITEVLNLRRGLKDDRRAKDTELRLHRLLLDAGKLTEEDLFQALLIIRDRKGPIAVHCWHGSDRTGAVIAMYEIIFQNKDKEAAINDMINGDYGFHKHYKNIPGLIRTIDTDAFRERLSKVPATR
ncbi:MAG: protein tyrosine phosphatase [Sphingobacteriales bacterium]|nr:MAG: protein tyrosine phosphatase [Sphingobacteriales bacterium]